MQHAFGLIGCGRMGDVWIDAVVVATPSCTHPDVVAQAASTTTSTYARELLDFLGAVDDGAEPENTPLNGLRNIGLGLALYRSMELGERIAFREGLPDPRQVPQDYQYRGPSGIR